MGYSAEKNKQYLNDRYADQRNAMYSYLGGVCVVCGSTQQLEIDHIDWRKKSFPVGRLWPVKKLAEVYNELDKCQLLCRPHHLEKSSRDQREIAAETRAPFKHGTMYSFMKMKCFCEECNNARDMFNRKRRESRVGKRQVYGRPSDHGDILHYRRGCKCGICRKANAEYAKSLRK